MVKSESDLGKALEVRRYITYASAVCEMHSLFALGVLKMETFVHSLDFVL